MKPQSLIPILLLVSVAALAAPAAAAEHTLEIRAHGFVPATLTLPAGVRIELHVKNSRALPSEFESYDLNREKVIPGGTTLSVWVGPLKPGKYKFFDDFNPGVTGWIVVAKPASVKTGSSLDKSS